jgi:hypothetical protein
MAIDSLVAWCKVTVVAFLHMPLRLPLEVLYRSAPSSVGGWDGRSDAEVCAALTGVKVDFWVANQSECARLVTQHFDARYTVVLCVIYFYVAFFFVRALLRLVHQKIYGMQKQQTLVYVLPWEDGRLVPARHARSSTL